MSKTVFNIKKLLIFFCFIFSQLSFAADAPKEIVKEVVADNRPNDLRLRTIYSMTNHNLESNGLKLSNSSKMGNGYEFIYRRVMTNGALRFLASSIRTDFEKYTGISPLEIKTEFIRDLIDYQFNSGFGLGLEYRQRDADDTTLSQALPRSQKTSLRTFYGSTYNFDGNLKLDYEVGIILPLVQYEKSPRTGAPSFVAAPDLELNLVYKVNHFIDVAVGVQVLYETSQFIGDGDRGTSSANETFIHTNFPIDLRFRF